MISKILVYHELLNEETISRKIVEDNPDLISEGYLVSENVKKKDYTVQEFHITEKGKRIRENGFLEMMLEELRTYEEDLDKKYSNKDL